MNIAVNTRLLLRNQLEGIGWFTKETLQRIVNQHPEHTFYFFFDRPYANEFIFSENVIPVVLTPPARHPILFICWFEWSVRRALKKYQIDLFLSPDGYLSLTSSTKQVAVIHDINFELYPQFFPWLVRWYLRHFFPRFAKKASRIATVSQFSKSELIAHYGCSEHAIDVVYNGAAPQFEPLSEHEKKKVQWHYTRNLPYFAYVGALQPRKNLAHLLQAFDQFKTTQQTEHILLIIGEKKWWPKAAEQAFQNMQHKKDVVFTGRLDQDELVKVVGSAEALCYVSFYEGFGIPVLEAMQAGVPVICSAISSMPEVAGDAAILVNPFDTTDIAQGMQKINADPQLRATLRQKGIERARQFSWDHTSSRLWECVEKALPKEN